MTKVLIIEDEKDLLEVLQYNLRKEGYHIETCRNGLDGLRQAKTQKPQLILLDVMLPGKDGFEICKELKKDSQTSQIPIIILTAKSEEVDRVLGLELGADDYVVKPFGVRELLARVRAVLRRSETRASPSAPRKLTIGVLTVDPERREVTTSGKSIDLSAKEFDLLYHLATTPGKVFTREELLDKVWGVEVAIETRTVDVHLQRLRSKLGKSAKYLTTVHGVGYKFDAE